jgi:hypothetical protein
VPAQAEACGYNCMRNKRGDPAGRPYFLLKGLGVGFGEFFISVRASALSPLPNIIFFTRPVFPP